MNDVLRIGTRRSKLALAQAREVAALLEATGARCELIPMLTSGDTGGKVGPAGLKGLFVHEIVRALQEDELDIAVHSAKDLPSEDPEGVVVAAVPTRGSAHDLLVTREVSLLRGARVGSSSLRRRGQLMRARPELEVVELRGNVDTRLRKLHDGEVDGLVLAEAGLRRLEIEPDHAERLSEDEMVPAPGQGALAVQTRTHSEAREIVTTIDDRDSHVAFDVERRVVSLLGGGCALPLGAYAHVVEDRVRLHAVVFRPDGSRFIEASVEGPRDEDVAPRAAQELLDAGAGEILGQLR
jgi:hydroxymethylbilane synthase